MNLGIKSVLTYCNVNKLSLNLQKTNYMLIASPQKRVNININNIERKSYIKYLGMFIDEHLRLGSQIQHISKNIGRINKTRYHLNLKVMKQLYDTFILPHLNYGILSWGNTYKTRLNTLCRKQNKCIRSIFFAHSWKSSTPYYKLLGILKLDDILQFKIANFPHKILNNKKSIPAVFSDFITPAARVHSYETRYTTHGNLCRTHIRTDYGRFMFRYKAAQV